MRGVMTEMQKLEWHTPTVTELIIPEEWRPVVGFEGQYEVSNYGRVKSLPRMVCRRSLSPNLLVCERMLKAGVVSRYGHLGVSLCKNGEQVPKSVHGLVLTAFVGPRPDGMQC